jgi:hypothetical protein
MRAWTRTEITRSRLSTDSLDVDAFVQAAQLRDAVLYARNSYLLLTEFTSVRGTISREQRKEVNQTCIG